jgi:hypothetical protein
MFVRLNLQSSVDKIQSFLEAKLCFKKRRDFYGPHKNYQFLLLVLDDLHLPQDISLSTLRYSNHRVQEFCRQIAETSTLIRLDFQEVRKYQDLFIFATRNQASSMSLRLMRHFFEIELE